MVRREIVIDGSVSTVRVPMNNLFSNRSSFSSSASVRSSKNNSKGQYQFTKASLDEIIKYRRCLIAIVLCLIYAIAGIFLIVLKSSPIRDTIGTDLAYSEPNHNNSNTSTNETIELEIINSWHVHTSDSSNTTQSLKHKHTTNGTREFKDCGSIEGKRVKYGNIGCLFRRASDSDLSGDLCCCPGPIKYKTHHNHTRLIKTANHSNINDTRTLVRPNIICFVTKSSGLFNIHKVVPPIARNSKVTFTVLKSHSCIECSCCQDRSPAIVNKLLSGEENSSYIFKSKSDEGEGFWVGVRRALVRTMQRLHDYFYKIYDLGELIIHNIKYGHMPVLGLVGFDHDHGVGLTIIEPTSTLSSSVSSKIKPIVDTQVKSTSTTDYDTFDEVDQLNSIISSESINASLEINSNSKSKVIKSKEDLIVSHHSSTTTTSTPASSQAKKSIIISLGDGSSKTIITTIETVNNDSDLATTMAPSHKNSSNDSVITDNSNQQSQNTVYEQQSSNGNKTRQVDLNQSSHLLTSNSNANNSLFNNLENRHKMATLNGTSNSQSYKDRASYNQTDNINAMAKNATSSSDEELEENLKKLILLIDNRKDNNKNTRDSSRLTSNDTITHETKSYKILNHINDKDKEDTDHHNTNKIDKKTKSELENSAINVNTSSTYKTTVISISSDPSNNSATHIEPMNFQERSIIKRSDKLPLTTRLPSIQTNATITSPITTRMNTKIVSLKNMLAENQNLHESSYLIEDNRYNKSSEIEPTKNNNKDITLNDNSERRDLKSTTTYSPKLSTTKRSQSIVITLPNDHKQINITTTN